MRKSLLKLGVGSKLKIEVGPTETPSPSPPSSPRTILIDLPAEYVDGFVEIQDDVVLSVDPSIAALLANPSRLHDVVGKSITHFALCCWGEDDKSAMSAFLNMTAGSHVRCRTSSVVSGKQVEWTAFKSKERMNRCVLLATLREHQECAALSLEMISDKEINVWLEAEHAVHSKWIDELEKEQEQALKNYVLEQEKGGLKSNHHRERNQSLEAESMVIAERNLRLEAEQVVHTKWIDELETKKEQARRSDLLEQDLLKERNQRLEAESKAIEERNLRLEAEQVVQSKWIDELEKEKEQARRNDFFEQEKRRLESDLLKERNQRLETEIQADSQLNHTLKVCTNSFLSEEVHLPQRPHCASFSFPAQNLVAEAKAVLELLLDADALGDPGCTLNSELKEV
jgi:hypothetical protein